MAKVLVVDDRLAVAGLVAQMLRTRGHEADQTNDAEEAKRLIADGGYDLILADAGICRHLGLKKDATSTTALVVMSSIPLDEQTKQGLTCIGASSFISKPFSIDQIDTVVRNTTAAS